MAPPTQPGTTYPVTPVDTEGVIGNTGGAPAGTSSKVTPADTENAGSGSRTVEPVSPPVTGVDTSGTNRSDPTTYVPPISTAYAGTPDTLQASRVGTRSREADPVYRAPAYAMAAATTKDTTRTDVQPGGAITNPVPTTQVIASTTETGSIGSAGTSTGVTPPVAPTAVTALTGPRLVRVGWTGSADPSGDPVSGYVVENSAGGTTYVGKNVTAVDVTNLSPDRTYTFRVRARNKAGNGPYSFASAAVRPYNPDEPDVLKPVTDPTLYVNAVYRPDGSVRPGTGGSPGAPTLGAVTAGAAASKTITVNWSAPTLGATPTSYLVTFTDGSTFTSAAGTTSKACVFAAAGASVKATVTALNAIGTGVDSAQSAAVTVP